MERCLSLFIKDTFQRDWITIGQSQLAWFLSKHFYKLHPATGHTLHHDTARMRWKIKLLTPRARHIYPPSQQFLVGEKDLTKIENKYAFLAQWQTWQNHYASKCCRGKTRNDSNPKSIRLETENITGKRKIRDPIQPRKEFFPCLSFELH